MKIAFPLVSTAELATDFANSRYIGFYDEANQQVEVFGLDKINQGMDSLPGLLISNQLEAVVSPQFNIMSLRILKENGIKALQAISYDLNENIAAIAEGGLQPFNLYASIFGGECGGGCSSCGSSCS